MMTMISFDIILKGILLVVFILLFLSYFNENKPKLPPGPWGIPIFGVMPFLNKPSYIKFQEYFKKYGKLCSFYVGSKLTIVISDFELLKEAFVRQGEIFSGRPESIIFKVFPDEKGIAMVDGNDFRQYKSFIVSTLKNFGAARVEFETFVKISAEHFVNYIYKTNEKAINILQPLGLSVAQSYSQLFLGKSLEFDDPILKELTSLFYQEQRLYIYGARLYLPWAKKIPVISKYIGEDDIRGFRKRIYEIFLSIMKENLDSYEDGSRKTFVHSWLTEDRKRKLRNPSDNLFGRFALLNNLDNWFSPAYETTTTTLRWAFLYLLKYPYVQDKLIKELDDVIGQNRLPCLYDEPLLPYMLAFIQETHRCASIVPLAAPHRNREATTLGGYYIPKSSYIYGNAFAIHTNSVLFPDPHKFKPERFIDKSNKFIKSEYVIPFSIGSRQCPGVSMAQTQIFIYLTYILQNFRLEKEVNEMLTTSDRSGSISAVPNNFKLKFVNRKK